MLISIKSLNLHKPFPSLSLSFVGGLGVQGMGVLVGLGVGVGVCAVTDFLMCKEFEYCRS